MSFIKYPDGSLSIEGCYRVIDLARIFSRLLDDQMQFAKLSLKFVEFNDDYSVMLRVYAVPSEDSEEIKAYPEIEALHLIDIDTDFLDL